MKYKISSGQLLYHRFHQTLDTTPLIANFLGREMIDTVVSDCYRVFSTSVLRVCSLLLVGHIPTSLSLQHKYLQNLKTDSMLDRLLDSFVADK